MKNHLADYDRGYWSNYDIKGTIASSAYHDLHIELLHVMFDLFRYKAFNDYSYKWTSYQNNNNNIRISMIVKLKQKMFRNDYYGINTSLVK